VFPLINFGTLRASRFPTNDLNGLPANIRGQPALCRSAGSAGSRARVHRINFSEPCVGVRRGRKFRGRHEAVPPNAAEPRTKRPRRTGANTWKGGARWRRGSETELSNVVDGTCIRWIAASFGNPPGRSPSCSPSQPPASPMSCHPFA